MLLVRHLESFPFARLSHGSVATIGSFDGMHLGHQSLLERVIESAEKKGIPSVVMSFEPMPQEYFNAEFPPARLMLFREKCQMLKQSGVDIFFCPRFDEGMREISVEDFVRKILLHAMNIQHLVIGDDFRFAAQREGDAVSLRQFADKLDFQVTEVPSFLVDHERVSSTAVRQFLRLGELEKAAGFLGRPYSMSGRVVHGQKLGRTLGFPTANIELKRRLSPLSGVYAVTVTLPDKTVLNAVASVGDRPTFDGQKAVLEVYIFDFKADLYGQYIRVDFFHKIRDQVKYDQVDELVSQMRKDVEMAKQVLPS